MLGTKLKVGDIIQVHGYVMLAKINDGDRLKVAQVGERYGFPYYDFVRPRGKKVVVRHTASNIDLWISSDDNPDLNKITLETIQLEISK